ncbi:phasin [Rhodospirillum rubrum]|uniref:phasin family protein n=1 Tax=Rhodospirillum rubrum TaxID=1085 RepID=UPI001903B5C6|nr:phasin family protein [Rhodospirillum rubrum]MBK1666070.1 phasin [Rhodospirillum rubrum]MBK1678196.1 phasin [Rhodospirillum rubrum]
MAKQPETFLDFDFTRYFADLKVPGVDVESLIASQKRNLDALTNANKLAFEGVQAIFKRQAEILRQSVEESAQAAQDIAKAETPQDKIAKQTEVAKESFEKSVANLRELVELLAKSNTEVFNLLNSRVSEVLDEAKDLVVKQQNATIKTPAPRAATPQK